MHRDPADESHGGDGNPPQGRPAGARSVTPHDATSPLSTSYPSPSIPGDTGRPAGPSRAVTPEFEPPPPPPFRSGARTVDPRGPQPPTAGWNRPPTSDSPPRPYGVAGTPGGAPPAFVPPPPPSPGPARPARRGWKTVLAAVVAVALLAGGVAIGALVVVDDSPETAAPAETVRTAAPTTAAPTIEDVPGPLTGEDSEEPIAAVAGAVAPSVVLIVAGDGQGSGIVWDADQGHIVSNAHVVAESSTVVVRLADGNEVPGTVVGTDSFRDIAVIRVDATGLDLTEAVFAPPESVEVGQTAVAIGSPFGLDQTVTAGIVSAVNRINPQGGSDPLDPVPVAMIQTDAPINPGNSGGALADRQGRVVGMNTSIRTTGVSDGNLGVGFAVPSDTILLIANRIVAGESLELGFLGVGGDSPTDGSTGALIDDVVFDGPADAAGIEIGDRVITLDGDAITSMAELAAEVKLYRPGDRIEVQFVRGEETMVATITLGTPTG